MLAISDQLVNFYPDAMFMTGSCAFQVDPKFLRNLKFSRKHNKKGGAVAAAAK